MSRESDQHDLLAWIEGEPLAPEQAERLRERLDADPSLRAWVEAVIEDRRQIQAWAEAEYGAAPAGLVSEAVAQVERDALVGPPTHQPPARGSQQQRLRITPMRLAAAAGLALLVSGATLIPLMSERPGRSGERAEAPPASTGDAGSPLASAERAPGGASPNDPATQGAGGLRALTDPEPEQPQAETSGANPQADQLAQARRKRPESPGLAEPEQARPIHPDADEPGMSSERAVSLLREHRLVVIVRSVDPESAVRAVEDASADREKPIGWTDAGADTRSSLVRRLGWARATGMIVRIVEIRPTAEAVEALVARLSAPEGSEARLAALDQPLPAPTPPPDEALWWSKPASEWSTRASTAVVFHQADPSSSPQSGGE